MSHQCCPGSGVKSDDSTVLPWWLISSRCVLHTRSWRSSRCFSPSYGSTRPGWPVCEISPSASYCSTSWPFPPARSALVGPLRAGGHPGDQGVPGWPVLRRAPALVCPLSGSLPRSCLFVSGCYCRTPRGRLGAHAPGAWEQRGRLHGV